LVAGLVVLAMAVLGWLGIQRMNALEARIQKNDAQLVQAQINVLNLKKNLSGAGAKTAASDVLLRLHGSNTIGDELAPLLAQGWLASMGGGDARIGQDSAAPENRMASARFTGVEVVQKVEILAKGSGHAFEHLRSGTCDLGMSSRPISESDLEAFEAEGILDMAPPGSEHVIALDAIAIVVHPGNPATSLSMDDVRRIFTGEIVDWSSLNLGSSGPIHLVGRDAKSGTHGFFKEVALGGKAYGTGIVEFPAHSQVAAKVLEDPQAIGYVSLPYVNKVKALGLREGNGPPVYPAAFSVRTEDYPLSRRLYLYEEANSTHLLAHEFLEFALGPKGQTLVEKAGFVPLVIEAGTREPALDDRLPGALREQLQRCERLSTTFRFGKDGKLDSRAQRDMERLRTILAQSNAGARLFLVGFSDSTGDPTVDLSRSRALAEQVREVWIREGGTKSLQVLAGGSWHPLASSTTAEGRMRNRRIEVWIHSR
jgi:phosphate transport system substrate-binding protein